MDFSFSDTIRLWKTDKAPAAWYFVTVPEEFSDKIKEIQSKTKKKRGRGSVKVEVRIGFFTRETSMFPSKPKNAYILPLKKEVREELRIGEGDKVLVYVKLLS